MKVGMKSDGKYFYNSKIICVLCKEKTFFETFKTQGIGCFNDAVASAALICQHAGWQINGNSYGLGLIQMFYELSCQSLQRSV